VLTEFYFTQTLIVKILLSAFCGSITKLNGDISLMTILCQTNTQLCELFNTFTLTSKEKMKIETMGEAMNNLRVFITESSWSVN